MKLILTLLFVFQISFSTEVIGFLTKYNTFSSYSLSTQEKAILTQVNLFPFTLDNWGGVSSYWTCSDVSTLKTAGLKVYMTVGGAEYSDAFDGAAGTYLNTFVANIVSRVNSCGFNGVDIDWEFPDTPDKATKFKNLIAKLRSDLPSGVKLSIDVPTQWLEAQVGAAPFEDGSSVFTNVDYVNVMNYDDFRTVSKPNHSGFLKSLDNMNYWLTKVGPEKLVNGVPFYGRPTGSSIASINYSEIPQASLTANSYDQWGTTYYFNGPEMIYDKALYTKNSGFHGIMYWAINEGSASLDRSPTNEYSLLYQINKGLTQTDRPTGAYGYPGFEKDDPQSAVIINHDGSFWRKTYGNYRNVEPYGMGNVNINTMWERNSEPWCDTYWKWQSYCTYSDQRFLNLGDKCYELNEGMTSTAGVSPESTQGASQWTEQDCTSCNVIDYGEDWSKDCEYQFGEVINHDGFLWEAIDLSQFGITAIPVGTTPSANNDIYWANLGPYSSSETSSSSATSSSSSSGTIALARSQTPNFIDFSITSHAISFSSKEELSGTLYLLSPLGSIVNEFQVKSHSGSKAWTQPLKPGRYYLKYQLNGILDVLPVIIEE